MKIPKTILVLAVLAVGLVGASYAAIPSADGTINACKDAKGTLRVIDAEAGQACNANQTPLSWNRQGPAGADGVSGYEVVFVFTTAPAGGGVGHGYAQCPDGKRPLGGGVNAPNIYLQVMSSRPTLGFGYPGYGWSSAVRNTGATAVEFETYAVCAFVD